MLSVIDISVLGKGFDYLSIENKTKPKLQNNFHEFAVDRILHGIFCSDSFPDFSEAHILLLSDTGILTLEDYKC